MDIRVELLVYVYIIMCVCMLLFNIIYITYSKTDKRRSNQSKNKWKKNILQEFQNNYLETNQKYAKWLVKKLKNLQHFLLFEDALDELKKENLQGVKRFLELNKEIFIQLGIYYSHKESMKKAFYAYVLSEYGDSLKDSRIPEILSGYVIDSSVYCRENALRALYQYGNSNAVVSAFLLMERNDLTHSAKLITDGLLKFTGDKEQLADRLLEKLQELSPSMQVPIIDFIRNASGNFGGRFWNILSDTATDDEVKMAVFRYYRKYKYEPAQEYLIQSLNIGEGKDWQAAAVAATALENYPEEESINALKNALYSSNWFVRSNAADALFKHGVTYGDLLDIYNSDDRYAREMIQYKMMQNN